MAKAALFSVGQTVHHRLFGYRGVIIDVDPSFDGDEEWYEMMALSRPSKTKPWYHLLVHGSIHQTYVPEANLEADFTGDPIEHPELNQYFTSFNKGVYQLKKGSN